MGQKIVTFLKERTPLLCVLATASHDAKPQSAVLGYVVNDDLSILLSTKKTTRKYNNLKENKYVSLTFGASFTEPYVQYQGIAELIEEGQEYDKINDFFYSIHEQAKRFKSPETIFVRVRPTWVRFTDYAQSPPLIEEKEF